MLSVTETQRCCDQHQKRSCNNPNGPRLVRGSKDPLKENECRDGQRQTLSANPVRIRIEDAHKGRVRLPRKLQSLTQPAKRFKRIRRMHIRPLINSQSIDRVNDIQRLHQGVVYSKLLQCQEKAQARCDITPGSGIRHLLHQRISNALVMVRTLNLRHYRTCRAHQQKHLLPPWQDFHPRCLMPARLRAARHFYLPMWCMPRKG